MQEIRKQLEKASLIEATIADYPTMQNMARFYVYDMSRYCGQLPGWECPKNGLYECVDLKNYITAPDNHAFLIKVGSELLGFALINKIGSTPDVDWHMGEFFVLAKFQGSGVGKKIAIEIFDRFSGIWEVSAIPENQAALSFWSKVIKFYTQSQFTESSKVVEHPKPHPMRILRFTSHRRET